MIKRRSKEAETTRTEKVIGNVLDAVIQIISLENIQNHQKTRTKEHSSETLGVIAVRKMIKRVKTKHVSGSSIYEVTNFDDDVDDLALNVDHVFEADQCDAYPTLMLMRLPPYRPLIIDHMDSIMKYTRCKAMYNTTLLLDFDAEQYECIGNNIPYRSGVQSRSANKQVKVVNDTLTSELARYKELVREKGPRPSFQKPLPAMDSVIHSNTPVKLVPKVLPTKSQVKINLYVLTQLFMEFDKKCKKRITLSGVTEGEREFHGTIFKEVKVMEEIFDQKSDEVGSDVVDKQYLEAEMSKIEDLKAQLEGNLKVAARSSVKTKVLAPGMYAIDVEPISPCLKNNRNAHLTYINHLKESCRNKLGDWLAPSPVPVTTYIPPTDKDLEILFQPMFNEYFDQSTDAGPTIEDTSITQADLHPLVNPVAGEPSSTQSTSGDVSLVKPNQVNQPPDHLRKWTKDHPLDNIVGNPSRPVPTRKQLAFDAFWCYYHTVLSKVKPKNFKMAVNEDIWFEAMQDEIHEFDRLKVWELVPRPPLRRRG
ncbi:hypothetical protein Tco_0489335 [Tanacetum coccineum]